LEIGYCPFDHCLVIAFLIIGYSSASGQTNTPHVFTKGLRIGASVAVGQVSVPSIVRIGRVRSGGPVTAGAAHTSRLQIAVRAVYIGLH